MKAYKGYIVLYIAIPITSIMTIVSLIKGDISNALGNFTWCAVAISSTYMLHLQAKEIEEVNRKNRTMAL